MRSKATYDKQNFATNLVNYSSLSDILNMYRDTKPQVSSWRHLGDLFQVL